MRDLAVLSNLEAPLTELLTTPNTKEYSLRKANTVEEIAGVIISELKKQGISEADCGDLEKHAYSVNDSIKDTDIRYMHILAAV